MDVDVLEQGSEPTPTASRWWTPAIVVAALAVVVAGALQVRGEPPPADGPDWPPLRPLPRVLLERAGVLTVAPAPGGLLHLRVGVEGVPRAQLLSLDVELPGSAVVLLPTPDRLTDDGEGLLVLDVLPRCPDALPGLSQAAIRAAVRGREGAPVRQVRVRLDTAGELTDAVRARCGAGADGSRVRTGPVRLDGPPGDLLRTSVAVSAADSGPVTVVDVRPGPGVQASLRTPLPVRLEPGGTPVALLVDLRRGGCGGAPDTPPYVLVLSTGDVVAPSVAPEVLPPLDAMRPYECPG